MRHDDGYSEGSILLSFLLGGLVGAGVALLVAPNSGQETRRRIREIAEDVTDRAGDYAEEVKGRVTSTIEKGRDYYQDKKSIIATAVEAGKEAYEREKEKHAKA